MNVTFEDKDKSVVDGVHNYFRDVDANEVKRAVNSKADADKIGVANGIAPLGPDGKLPPQYIDTQATAEEVPFTPAGNITATDVQAAIEELDAEKQAVLGFVPENVGNKATNLSENTSNTKYPTVKATADGDAATLEAAKAYADSVNTNVLHFRGYFDPTGATVYPTTGGTGTAGAIMPGDTWEISVAIADNPGVHPAYDVGDLIVAKIATPGQTAANWGKTAHNTTQATELARGTAMLATQAEIQDNSTPNDIDIVTPLKFWYGITKFLTLAWTFAQKITFTSSPRLSSVTANQYLKVDATKDVTSVATIPGADVDAATDTARGSVELATSTEVRTGTDTQRAVTPAGVAARINKLPVMEFAADYISGTNLVLSGVGAIVQGDALVAGKVVVANGQATPTQNGIYIVDAGAWLHVGVTYNNDVYNYAGNFEGARIFVRKNKKFYNQITLASELGVTGQIWEESAAGSGGAVETFASDFTVVLSGGKTFGKYTNGQIVPASGKTPMQVLLDIAVEYLLPAFSAFGLTGQATQVEVGTTIASGSKTFTWGTTNSGNIKPNIIKIKNQTAGTDLATALANDGTESGVNVPAPIQLNANNATQVFRIEAENTQNTVFNRDLTIIANFLRFYGCPVAAPANSADVRALGNSTFGNTFNINIAVGKQIIAFAYEDTRPDISDSSVKYVEGFNSNVGNTFTKFTFNVNDAGGTARGYKIYVATLGAPASSAMTYAVTIP